MVCRQENANTAGVYCHETMGMVCATSATKTGTEVTGTMMIMTMIDVRCSDYTPTDSYRLGYNYTELVFCFFLA